MDRKAIADAALRVINVGLDTPVGKAAIRSIADAREMAQETQTAAMSALNLPTADEVNRLFGRLRQMSQRLEDVEDTLERIEKKLDDLARSDRDN
ncbi:MAG: hypothetical protein LLG14_22875 [Nocardiaceae bacterium]|nr:hypothetical protein [Nocardiaceae bacterium]